MRRQLRRRQLTRRQLTRRQLTRRQLTRRLLRHGPRPRPPPRRPCCRTGAVPSLRRQFLSRACRASPSSSAASPDAARAPRSRLIIHRYSYVHGRTQVGRYHGRYWSVLEYGHSRVMGMVIFKKKGWAALFSCAPRLRCAICDFVV